MQQTVFYSLLLLSSRCINFCDVTSLIMLVETASRAIHSRSLFNVTAAGLDLCLFKKKKKKSAQAACLAPFNVFVLWLFFFSFQMLNVRADKSSRLIPHPTTRLIVFLPCFCLPYIFLISPSLSPSFSLPPFLSLFFCSHDAS